MEVLTARNGGLDNAAPKVFARAPERAGTAADLDPDVEDAVDAREIFDLIRNINDPEHPLTLEQLNVVSLENISVQDGLPGRVVVKFRPTIPHCSMAMMIGLCIRVKLSRCLPERWKCEVLVTPGSHVQGDQISKQLCDKERVAAALERPKLLDMVNVCLRPRY